MKNSLNKALVAAFLTTISAYVMAAEQKSNTTLNHLATKEQITRLKIAGLEEDLKNEEKSYRALFDDMDPKLLAAIEKLKPTPPAFLALQSKFEQVKMDTHINLPYQEEKFDFYGDWSLHTKQPSLSHDDIIKALFGAEALKKN